MKLFKTLAVSTIFTSAVIVACSGSTTSNNPPAGNDSGTNPQPGTDGGPGPTTDSSTPIDAAPGCTPTSGCSTGQTCCITAAGSSCIASTATCSGAAVSCTNSSTCSTGQVCCATFGGASLKAACAAAPCPAGAYDLCASSNECPTGQTCQPLSFGGTTVPGITTCQAPKADAGPSDSGTDSSSPVDASDDGG